MITDKLLITLIVGITGVIGTITGTMAWGAIHGDEFSGKLDSATIAMKDSIVNKVKEFAGSRFSNKNGLTSEKKVATIGLADVVQVADTQATIGLDQNTQSPLDLLANDTTIKTKQLELPADTTSPVIPENKSQNLPLDDNTAQAITDSSALNTPATANTATQRHGEDDGNDRENERESDD